MGQVRRLYSFKSFHSRLQGLSYIDHTLSVGPQQPLPKPPVRLSEKLHYEFNSLAKWTSSIPTKRISSYKTKYLDKSVGHPHSMCADCQKSENFFNFPSPPPPATPWCRCSHDGHSGDGVHLFTGTAQGTALGDRNL